MTQPPMPAPVAPARPPGPRLLTSFLVMGAGILLGIVAVVAIVIPLAGSFTSTGVHRSRRPAPAPPRRARYTVYQYTGTRSVFGGSDNLPVTRIPVTAVTVTDPDGTRCRLATRPTTRSSRRGRNVYHAALFFDAPVDGDYLLQFRNTNPTRVIVSRSIVGHVAGRVGLVHRGRRRWSGVHRRARDVDRRCDERRRARRSVRSTPLGGRRRSGVRRPRSGDHLRSRNGRRPSRSGARRRSSNGRLRLRRRPAAAAVTPAGAAAGGPAGGLSQAKS